ncbi:MAG: hypothetical protein HC901_00420, partial [Bdellovibrionaceae bacterium]|nr:hypothetical protein [Pseudobdellovibrionaceae bacterium]
GIGDNAAFDQVNDAFRKQLGVYAQVAPITQIFEHGVGNTADARLDCAFIFDQACDVLRDLALQL